jgi:hypothetical protein
MRQIADTESKIREETSMGNAAGDGQSGSGQNGESGSGDGQQASGGGGGQPQGDQGAPENTGANGGGGQGPGEGSQAAAGSGPDDSGKGGGGSTNLEGRSGPGDKEHGREVGKQGTFVKIYDSNPIANKGDTVKAGAQLDLHGQSAGSVPIMGPGDKDKGPLVDYSTQLPAARKLAEDALTRQQIPPQYRELIRSYYEK